VYSFASSQVGLQEKVRLLAMFIITQEGIQERDRKMLMKVGQIRDGGKEEVLDEQPYSKYHSKYHSKCHSPMPFQYDFATTCFLFWRNSHMLLFMWTIAGRSVEPSAFGCNDAEVGQEQRPVEGRAEEGQGKG
jgi:hypothetical protein